MATGLYAKYDSSGSCPSMSKRGPAVALTASRVRSKTKRQFAVRKALRSGSNVTSVDLRYTSLRLGGAVSLVRVCNTPRRDCSLDCCFSVGQGRVNRHFAIGIAMASMKKHDVSRSMLVAVSKSFTTPMFSTTPSTAIAMLVGGRAGFGLQFATASSHTLSCIAVGVPNVSKFSGHHMSTSKGDSLGFTRVVMFPGRPGDCGIAVATFSGGRGSAAAADMLGVSRVPSFPGVCLTSITATRRLGDSVFKMPVMVRRANRCRCGTGCCYRGTKAGVFFLPRGDSFAPVYFKLSPRSGAGLASSPRATVPVMLSRTGICCRVGVSIGGDACGLGACSVTSTMSPVPRACNSVDLSA